jgi:hypothetical protein
MNRQKSIVLPAGKYYIGDPCYIFNDNWDEVLDQTKYFEGGGVFEVFGQKVVGGSTNYGDGMYYDNFGRGYAVDAGLIAIVPVALLLVDNVETVDSVIESDNMHIVEFEKPFVASYIDGGSYQFGEIEIETGDEDEDEEDDYYDDEEEDDNY